MIKQPRANMRSSFILPVIVSAWIFAGAAHARENQPSSFAGWTLRGEGARIEGTGLVFATGAKGRASAVRAALPDSPCFEVRFAHAATSAAGGELGFKAQTGAFRLFLLFREQGLRYLTAEGPVDLPLPGPPGTAREYRVVVRDERAFLWVGGRPAAAFALPGHGEPPRLEFWANGSETAGVAGRVRSPAFRSLSREQARAAMPEMHPRSFLPEVVNDWSAANGWTLSDNGASISPEGWLDLHSTAERSGERLVQAFLRMPVPDSFEYEFRARLLRHGSGEIGAKIEYYPHRLLMYFQPDKILFTSRGGLQAVAVPLGDAWHVWRVSVERGRARLHMDGALLAEFEMQAAARRDNVISYWARHVAPDFSRLQVDRTRFTPYRYDLMVRTQAPSYAAGQPVKLRADVIEGEADLAEVSFVGGGRVLGRTTAAPHVLILPALEAGDWEVVAVSRDRAGIERRSEPVAFTVEPEVRLTRLLPREGETHDLREPLTVEVRADSAVGIERVEVTLDDGAALVKQHPPFTFDLGRVGFGRHTLRIAATNRRGERSTHVSEIPAGLVWRERTALAGAGVHAPLPGLPSSYEIRLRAELETEAGVLLRVGDGRRGIELPLEKGTAAGIADVRIVVEGDRAWLYSNGRYERALNSGAAPAGALPEIRVGALSGNPMLDALEVLPLPGADDLLVENGPAVSANAGGGEWRAASLPARLPSLYVLEWDMALPPGGRGIRLETADGKFRTELHFKPGEAVRTLASPLGKPEGTLSTPKPDAVVEAGSHPWRLEVARGLAMLFCGDAHMGSWRMPPSDEPAALRLVSVQPEAGMDAAQVTSLRLRRSEDIHYFESEGMAVGTPGSPSLLHVFARNLVWRARLRPAAGEGGDNGGVWLAARWNDARHRLLAGYNGAARRWEIVEESPERTVQAGEAGVLPGDAFDLELTLDGANAVLRVDGREVARGQVRRHHTYGKVGLFAHGLAVTAERVFYRGEGAVQAGVHETVADGGFTTDLVELKDGTLLLSSYDLTVVRSRDRGLTWSKAEASPRPGANVLRLRSGKIIAINRTAEGAERPGTYKDAAWISEDEAATWTGPWFVQPDWRNRVTMNGKIIQTNGGRIVYTSGETGHGGETHGAVRAYYSDDDGRTWAPSDDEISHGRNGINAQEAKIVELPDGALKMYMRTDLGFLYETVSHDGGKTWPGAVTATPFMAPLCAFNIERDPQTGHYYMFWPYTNKNESAAPHGPRHRIALARSEDGTRTWRYLMDVDDWEGNSLRFMNLGLDVTRDHLFLNAARCQGDGMSGPIQSMLYRVEKAALRPQPRFPNVHLRAEP